MVPSLYILKYFFNITVRQISLAMGPPWGLAMGFSVWQHSMEKIACRERNGNGIDNDHGQFENSVTM